MKDEILKQIGLSDHQIKAYLYLLKHGPTPPPQVAKQLKLTRTNAYKVLGQLIEMGLVSRLELNNKLHYRAEDPIALASIAAEERNRVIALEKNVKEALKQMRHQYQQSSGTVEVQKYQGEVAIKALYEHQAKLGQPIYFVKSRADIPVLGFELMDYIRKLPVKLNIDRYGITPDAPEAPANPQIDKSTKLTRTWIPAEDYTAPVEWAVAGDELTIINFSDKTSAIRIKDAAIAEAFRQLWLALDKNLRTQAAYKRLPRQAKRKI